MPLHLNWDGKQTNGIIFNDSYKGALYTGAENKPDIVEPYDSFLYTEVFDGQLNYIELDEVKKVMTPEQEATVVALATTWVQPLGQEGNPTREQKDVMITNKATAHIESVYSPLKQRKLLSIAVSLQDQRLDGITLTTEEQALRP